MSDDDRMDRAERIRKMREGNRAETDDESTDTEAESTDAGVGTDADSPEPADTDSTAVNPAESTTDTDQRISDGEDANSATATDDERESASDETEAAAMEAAQRAAQAATEVTGGAADATAETTEASQETGDISAAANPMQGPTGVELPDQALIEEAMQSSATSETVGSASAAAMEDQSSQSEELVRVLEFALGDEYYCLDIEYVEEIVKRDDVTRVPNTDAYVEGVVDLRGQITTILDPKEMMDIDAGGDQTLIVVFDPEMFEEQGAVGWIVDEVRQVAPVTEDEVNSPPVDASYINGVVDREDREQFVIWVEPDDALEAAVSDD